MILTYKELKKIDYNKLDQKTIPKFIFRSGPMSKDDLPEVVLNVYNNIIELNPEYKFFYFSDIDCEKFIFDYYGSFYVDLYNKLNPTAFKSDFWRYLVLYKFGGCYGDFTQTPKVPYDELCKDVNQLYCRDTASHRVGLYNAIICTFPNNIVISKAIDICVDNIVNNKYNKNPLDVTGPYVLGRAFSSFNLGNRYVGQDIKIGTYNGIRVLNNPDDKEFLQDIDGIDLVLKKIRENHQILYNDSNNNIYYDTLWNKKNVFKENILAGFNLKGIKYYIPRGNSGYSNAAKDYIISINQSEIPITCQYLVFNDDIYEGGERNDIVNSLINKDIDYNVVIIHATPDNWGYIIDEEKKKNPDVKIIGMTVWETNKLPEKWVNWINAADTIIVPCRWNIDVFLKSGVVKPIFNVPHIYKNSKLEKFEIKNIGNEFIFYTIGQWTGRKGLEDTIYAYLTAFKSTDDVCLVIKTHGINYESKEIKKINDSINLIKSKFKNPAKIVYLKQELSDENIQYLHNIGHCYLSLTKGEGWGLGACDAVCLGKPVVITGYGGQAEFVLPETLVNYTLVNVLPSYGEYKPNQKWAKPSIVDAVEKIKNVYSNYAENLKKSRYHKDYIIKKYSHNRVIDQLKNILYTLK